MGAPVVHFEIVSRNGDQLKEFYSQLFGWKIDSNNPMGYGLVPREGDYGIGGGISNPGPDGLTHVTVYASVPDPQATLDRAMSMGATLVTPVTEIPGMVTFALFNDPDGNRIGIIKDQPMPEKPAAKRKTRRAKPKAKKAAKKPARKAKKANRRRR